MQLPQTTDPKQSPKLTQFLDEINDVCKRYQYTLKPILSFNQNGISPSLSVIDVVPLRKENATKIKKEVKK